MVRQIYTFIYWIYLHPNHTSSNLTEDDINMFNNDKDTYWKLIKQVLLKRRKIDTNFAYKFFV